MDMITTNSQEWCPPLLGWDFEELLSLGLV